MKKFLILSVAALLAGAGSANAQSLLELLGRQAAQQTQQAGPGSAGQTGQAGTPAVEKIGLDELKGVWKYTGAAVEFTGTDLVAMIGSSVAAPTIKQSLETYYARAGVVAGACTLEFGDRDVFTARTAAHTVEGSYRFDAQARKVVVSYDNQLLGGKNTLEGKLTFTGGKLALTFESEKIVAVIKELTKNMTLDQNVQDLIRMISEYKGLYLGFEMGK